MFICDEGLQFRWMRLVALIEDFPPLFWTTSIFFHMVVADIIIVHNDNRNFTIKPFSSVNTELLKYPSMLAKSFQYFNLNTSNYFRLFLKSKSL